MASHFSKEHSLQLTTRWCHADAKVAGGAQAEMDRPCNLRHGEECTYFDWHLVGKSGW